MRIFLDMDGVVVDFIRPAIRIHSRNPDDVIANWPQGEFDVASVLGITTREFWAPISAAGWRWWVNLPVLPWAEELMNVVNEFAGEDWLFASSPSRSPQSASGKVRWLQNRYTESFRSYMLGEHKHLFAKPGHVLIDDREESVIKFREHSGHAVLFPQPWNQLGAMTDPVAYVRSELLAISNLESVKSFRKDY
jgi:hypothetical protein